MGRDYPAIRLKIAEGVAPVLVDWVENNQVDFAVILLDVQMPGMSGFEVQSHLADAGHRIPVVVITGRDTPAERRSRLAALASGEAAG